MTETCEVLMLRRPMVNGQMQEGHLAVCARSVEADGLCAFHLRQAAIPPDARRRERRALRLIGRG